MADDHVWVAEEFERRSPDERQRLLDERVVTDLNTLSPDYGLFEVMRTSRGRGTVSPHSTG